LKISATMPRFVLPAALLGGLCVCGCAPTAYKITPVPVDRTLKEITLIHEGGLAPPKIVLIDVEGLITNRRRFTLIGEREHPVSLFTEKLDKAAGDRRVGAIVLRINSPGGSVTATDLMYSELMHFKSRTDGERPVVAALMDVAASGGYYIACAADEIIAQPTTVTGSIGVLMQLVDVSGTMRKIGIEPQTIKSVDKKDAGSPLRTMRPEEREIFQGLVDHFHSRFVEVVAAGRAGLDEAAVREAADGRVYTAEQALELGFIDRIGTLRVALGAAKTRMGVDRVRVVTYERPLGWRPNIYAEEPAPPAQVNLFNINLPDWLHPEPQFMYLWAPEL
jgi:protease IV